MWKPAHRKHGYSSGYHASFIEEENFGLAAYKSLVFFGFLFRLGFISLPFFLTIWLLQAGPSNPVYVSYLRIVEFSKPSRQYVTIEQSIMCSKFGLALLLHWYHKTVVQINITSMIFFVKILYGYD